MKSPGPLLSALSIVAVCWAAPVAAQQEKAPSPPASPETFDTALKRAYQLISDGKFAPARSELEQAAALAGKPCGECLLGFSHVFAADRQWERAVEAAQKALPLLSSPGLQARAYDQLGVAYVALKDPDRLTKAEDAFRRGADLGGPWGAMARYNLAEVLARQQRWTAAADAARLYLQDAGPDGTSLKEARIVLCQARSHLSDEPALDKKVDSELKRGGEGEVTQPEIIYQVKPVYPEIARQAGTRGTVIVEAIIDQEGCVSNIRPLQKLPNGLTEAAMEAVRQWAFSPATLDGQPVKVYYVLTVNFQVQASRPVVLPPGP